MLSTKDMKDTLKGTEGMTVDTTTIGKVISADGTRIGYRQMGTGPGLVILHGGWRASQHYLRLGEALAGQLTVTIPDRRGRGLSGPVRDIQGEYSLDKECEDLDALLRATGATPRCRSRWGDDFIYDMVGNLDEWVDDEHGAFAGGFYARSTRAGCDALITAHPRKYLDYSLGTRCCLEAKVRP